MGRKLITRPRQRRARRTGKSPYARYAKRPYAYNALHADWSRAAMAGQEAEAEQLAAKHRATYRW